MESQPFEVSLRAEPGKRVIFDLSGEIDSFAKAALDGAYTTALENGAPSLLLNFSQVSYINSSGIALIVNLLAGCMKMNRSLIAYGLNPHYQGIFKITRLADYIPVYMSESEALASIDPIDSVNTGAG